MENREYNLEYSIQPPFQRTIQLLQDSVGNEAVVDIAEVISAVLGWSALVLNPALRVLSGTAGSRLREGELRAIEECKTGGLARENADSELIPYEPEGTVSELYLPVRGRGDNLLGVLCLFNDKGTPLDMDLSQLCVLALRMRLYERSLRIQDGETTALIRLLEEVLQGTVTDPAYINRMLAAERFPKKRNMCFVFVETSKGLQRRPDTGLLSCLMEIWPISYPLIIQSNIVLLVCSDEMPLDELRQAQYSELLTRANVYGSVSEVFHKVDQYLGYYLCRAVCAAKAADRLNLKQRFATFDQVTPTAILFAEKMPYGARKCCDPKLIQLIELDRKGGTEYLKSLLAYWRFHEDRDAAAESLKIHRNTLSYRLKKIEEYLECNLADPNAITSVYFTLSVLRYLGELGEFDFPI